MSGKKSVMTTMMLYVDHTLDEEDSLTIFDELKIQDSSL